MASISSSECKHDNGRRALPWEKHQLEGVCIKCGVDLDKVYLERRMQYIEKKLGELEEKLASQKPRET